MEKETQELLKSIDNRLKWLLKLEVEDQFDNGATNKTKIKVLYKMGFSNGEMAEVVSTSKASVRATLSNLRDEGAVE